jgi:histidine triad (HIT) family protein
MSETIFSKIIRREIPAQIIYEDELCLAFHDIHPQAPVHVLIIPKKPIARIGLAQTEDQVLLGHLFLKVGEVARLLNLADNGFRVVVNHGRDGGETVPHLHLHLLGGRPLAWPPG